MKIARVCWPKTMMLVLGMTFLAPTVLASEGGAAFAEGVNYLPIKPALVVNYGGPGKVKYIKAEISMRVDSAHAAQEVTHHMPLVRDTLIMLLSSMSDEQVASGEGKEQMRQQALAKVNEALEAQMGHGAKEEKTAEKDAHAKADEHGKKDSKASAEHGKEDSKDGKAAEHAAQLVTDLLFDNLVVQK